MRRIALVLTVAALMAVMMLSAGPAKADVVNTGNTGGFENQQFVVIIGNHGSGGDWWDRGRCCHHGWWSLGGDWLDNDDVEVSGWDVEFS